MISKRTLTVLTVTLILCVIAPQLYALETRYPDSGSGNIQLTITPSKDVYRKGEAIQFKVKADRDFYLYLFNINPTTNKGTLLLPNSRSPERKLTAGKTYTIPGGEFEIYGDMAGTEKVIAVASTEKLKISTSSFSKDGDFFSADAEDMEQEAKSLAVRDTAGKSQKVMKELELVIIGE